MQTRHYIALAIFPVVGILLLRAWSAALTADARRLERDSPPPVLQNAYAQFRNRITQAQIQAKHALQRQRFGVEGLVARAFPSLEHPSSLFWNAPSTFVEWRSLNGEAQTQLLTYSNEVQRLRQEFLMTTHNSLPRGFPR